MNSIKVSRYDSINDIKKEEWDFIVSENQILNSYGYLKAIEDAKINNNEVKYRYFLFYINNKLIANATVVIFDSSMPSSPENKRGLIEKLFPNLLKIKFIESGFPTAIGNAINIKDEKYLQEIIELFDKELILLAKEEKTSLIIIRDITTYERKKFDFLFTRKYKIALNFPDTLLKVAHSSFADYLSDLNSKRRHEIKHHLKIFAEKNCTVEKIYYFSSYCEDLYKLWHNTYSKAKDYQREILTVDYFRNIANLLKEKAFILLCKKEGKPIGFTMFIENKNTLISTYCGLDYDYTKECHTYFVLFYKSIEETITQKKKYLELGVTNYNPKIEIGAIPEPVFIYGKSTNPFFNLFFVNLLKMINTSPSFNKRHIFNSRYYKRFDAKNKIFALIENKEFLISDISWEGIGLETDFPLKLNKKLDVRIFDEDHFGLEVKCKVLSVNKKDDSKWRIGLQQIKLNNEYLHSWNNIVSRFEINES